MDPCDPCRREARLRRVRRRDGGERRRRLPQLPRLFQLLRRSLLRIRSRRIRLVSLELRLGHDGGAVGVVARGGRQKVWSVGCPFTVKPHKVRMYTPPPPPPPPPPPHELPSVSQASHHTTNPKTHQLSLRPVCETPPPVGVVQVEIG